MAVKYIAEQHTVQRSSQSPSRTDSTDDKKAKLAPAFQPAQDEVAGNQATAQLQEKGFGKSLEVLTISLPEIDDIFDLPPTDRKPP